MRKLILSIIALTLGTPHPGPAVKVTKGDKEVILYLPDKVEYIIKK